MNLQELKLKKPADLIIEAEKLGIENPSTLRKQEILFAILKKLAEKNEQITAIGVLEVLQDGFGFLRAIESNYLPGPDDIYVSPGQNRRGTVTKGLIPLDIKDAEALARNKEHDWKISPTITRNRQVKFNNANINERVGAYLPIHFNVRGYDLEYGRLFTEEENLGRKRVVVIGLSLIHI